jgi:diguanylate cyclase (GGDEF)-like protein
MQALDIGVQRRQNALRALLAFTLPGAALFFFINLQLDAVLLALLDLALLLVSLGLLVAMRREVSVSLQALALIYLLVLFINIIAAFARPDIHPGMYSWLGGIPVLSYLLLEARLALPLAAVSLAAAMGAYFVGAEIPPHRVEILGLAHVLTPTLGLFVVCHFYARSRTRSDEHMLERVFREPLTGLWNREKLTSEFVREQQRTRRTGMPLSLILIDLDHFKAVNDRYGHDAGDAALLFFAALLKRRMRDTDLPCRIGGEEFAVLLPDTPAAGAVTVAEDLRQALETSDFRYGGERIRMTLSAGVVELGRDGSDWPELYRAADARLYACKAKGRNCVLSSLLVAA